MLVFLFTDIEGSSRLWEEHTTEMGEVIARHDAILRQTIESAGGRITKHTGDGVTAAFDDGEPITCALETQQRFAAEAWGAICELRIRAGLHAGEAEFQMSAGTPEGDYFGPPVNATARVMSAAWGGQVLLTPEVTQAAPLPRGATLRDLGEHLLKNVSAPQQLYQLDHPQLPWREFPPPHTLSGQSIRQAVDERGSQLAALDPGGMAVGLMTAILLPALQGELDPESGALEGNLGVLETWGRARCAPSQPSLPGGCGPNNALVRRPDRPRSTRCSTRRCWPNGRPAARPRLPCGPTPAACCRRCRVWTPRWKRRQRR